MDQPLIGFEIRVPQPLWFSKEGFLVLPAWSPPDKISPDKARVAFRAE
jgi:hypothetical protein